jgi:hypothetical protein
MIAKIFTRLNLSATNPFFTSAELLAFINDGYKDFCSRTESLKKFVLIDVVADQTAYDLPSDFYKFIWLGYDDEQLPVSHVSDLDIEDENWIGRAGTPYTFVSELGGLGAIKLHLTPAASSVALSAETTAITDFDDWNDNLLLYHAYTPADMLTGATPEIQTSYQWALIYYTLWKCYDMEGDFKDNFQAKIYQARYFDYVKKKSAKHEKIVIASSKEAVDECRDFEYNGEEIEYQLSEIGYLIIYDDGRMCFGDNDTDSTWRIRYTTDDELAFEERSSGSYTEKGLLE